MMYSAAYTIGFGMLGATLNRAMSGENPKEVRDYFYPRTGKKLSDGSDERLMMPTMLKEVMSAREAYRKNGLIAGIPTYAAHKLNPLFSMMYDLATNKNYYGVEIRDPGADVLTNVIQYAKYFGEQGITPIAVSGFLRHKDQTGEYSALPLFGFNPAPMYVTRSKAQKEIYDAYGEQIGDKTKTQAEYEKYQKKAAVKVKIQQGKIKEAQQEFYKLKHEGVIGHRVKWHTFYKRYTIPSDIRVFGMLSNERQQRILDKISDEEKQRYLPYVRKEKKKRRRKIKFM